jgi:hypothetical protein
MEGGIEVMERKERILKQLADELKQTRGYWMLKEKALDRTQW